MPLSSWITPPRRDGPELLDMGVGSAADVAQSLRDLRRVNALLGGTWSLTRHLYPRLRRYDGPVTVLDIGAGSGDTAQAMTRWAAQENRPVRVIAADITAKHLRHIPTDTAVPPLQADALRLPLAPNSIDYAVSSLFLHHLSPVQTIALLRDVWRAVRGGLLMSDLVRGRLPEIAWHLTRPIFAHSWITYHDGLVSVQRSYTPGEFAWLAAAAGIPNATVYTQFPWRMVLVADKDGVV
jgi:SAM-dependent methyltransferase